MIAIHNSINVIKISLNWTEHIELEDRGGTLNKNNTNLNLKWKNNLNLREVPCFEPNYYINIYHDGSVMPCCHLRSDNSNHKEFIMGNLKNNSIIDIF